ncbi:MAG TPA: hypothetical protein VMV04_09395 [Thermodesulfobacteriota bacterium]|nr:hypothetical protein [Thermodesulfobacteriota bacterium]
MKREMGRWGEAETRGKELTGKMGGREEKSPYHRVPGSPRPVTV